MTNFFMNLALVLLTNYITNPNIGPPTNVAAPPPNP
jgi:hypothetical protein